MEGKCDWVEDEWDSSWHTSCANIFYFVDDGPKENQFKFCPFCGKNCVEIQLLKEMEDEED